MDFDSDQESLTPHQQVYIKINTTGALWLPTGTVAQRPGSPQTGFFRYNTDTPGLEYWDGGAWTAPSGGGGGGGTNWKGAYGVDWYIDANTAALVYNPAGPTLDFSHAIFTEHAAGPTAGQTVYLAPPNTTITGSSAHPTDEGVYTLGSVASPSAVPITRHTDWPSSRTLTAGQIFVAKYAPDKTFGVGDPEFVIDDTLIDTVGDTISYGGSHLGIISNHSIAYLYGLDSGASWPSPLSSGLYYGKSEALNSTFDAVLLKITATNGGSAVNLTTTGSVGSSFYIGKIAILPMYNQFSSSQSSAVIRLIGSSSQAQTWTWAAQSGSSILDVSSYLSTTTARGLASNTGTAGQGAVSIGRDSFASFNGVALGQFAYAVSGVALGDSAIASDTDTIAIGGAAARGNSAISIGAGSTSVNGYGVSIGNQANSSTYGIALGYLSRAEQGATVSYPLTDVYKAGGTFTTQQQDRRVVIGNRTTDATPTALLINSSDAFVTLWATSDAVIKISGNIRGFSSSGYKVWRVEGYAFITDTSTGSVSAKYIQDIVQPGVGESWKVALTASYNGTLGLWTLVTTVTGQAATTIVWEATLGLEFVGGTAHDDMTVVQSPTQSEVLGTFTAVPSVTLAAGDLVNAFNSSGTLKLRLASTSSGYAADGYVLENYSTSDTATVYVSGVNPFKSSLTVGPLYLSTSGGVTSTMPSTGNLVQLIGFATASTKYVFQRGTPVQT